MAAASLTLAMRNGPLALALSAPTASRRKSARRSMASAAVASVPRVAAARCICSCSPPAASVTAIICAWLTETVAAKASRSSPSHREASGVPSRISFETSRPSPTSRALHATFPSKSWRSSMARPSFSTRPASTWQVILLRYLFAAFAATFAQQFGHAPKLDNFPLALLPDHENARGFA